MTKTQSIWSRIVETAACQFRNGWLLVPISVAVTIAVLRIGLAVTCLLVFALGGVLLVRRYRITVQRKNDD